MLEMLDSGVHTAKTKCRKFETNIHRKGISGPQSQFPHSCVCEQIIHIFPWWVCLFCWRKYVDRSSEYINRSQTHECGNWGWGRAIPRKGIYKRNCRCSACWKMQCWLLMENVGKSCNMQCWLLMENVGTFRNFLENLGMYNVGFWWKVMEHEEMCWKESGRVGTGWEIPPSWSNPRIEWIRGRQMFNFPPRSLWSADPSQFSTQSPEKNVLTPAEYED
jgi:hypothetical protein